MKLIPSACSGMMLLLVVACLFPCCCSSFVMIIPRQAATTTSRLLHLQSEKNPSDEANAFESMVRSVTGKSDYKFGDLTRGAVSTTTTVVEDLAKKTHLVDDDYQFGDITKGAISSISKPVENALSGAERTLALVTKEASIHEVVALSHVFWTETLTEAQRRETWIVGIYLAAVAVLAYNFVSNMQAGMVTAASWTRTAMVTGQSPRFHWARFLQIQETLNMVFGVPFLPARAIVTIKVFFPYRRLVSRLEQASLLREKYPLLNRVTCVFGAWVIFNLFSVGLFTGMLCRLGSVFAGVSK